jgi:hypothetical protein
MEIKVFVVKTELENNPSLTTNGKLNIEVLAELKQQLIKLFDGLTEIKNCAGYWVNNKGLIESDKISLWLIYTDKDEYSLIFQLREILSEIKALTMQKTQVYTINNNLFSL